MAKFQDLSALIQADLSRAYAKIAGSMVSACNAPGGYSQGGVLPPAASLGGYHTGGYVGPNAGSLGFRKTPPPFPGGSMTTSTPVNDFAGLPFDLAIGEVYGQRVWRVDDYGRLRARHMSQAKPWRPGVNTAECCAADWDRWGDAVRRLGAAKIIDPEGRGRIVANVRVNTEPSFGPSAWNWKYTYELIFADGTGYACTTPPQIAGADLIAHEVPDEQCRCGFYAYTEPDHSELKFGSADRMVLGVIKGTGRTLLGVRGFRCEKAEIVALLNPAGAGEGSKASYGKELERLLRRVYPDVPLLPTRKHLKQFAPVEPLLPDPADEAFWDLP